MQNQLLEWKRRAESAESRETEAKARASEAALEAERRLTAELQEAAKKVEAAEKAVTEGQKARETASNQVSSEQLQRMRNLETAKTIAESNARTQMLRAESALKEAEDARAREATHQKEIEAKTNEARIQAEAE